MMRVVEEVTNVSESFRRERTARAQTWIEGSRDAIARLQRERRADPDLDPLTAARALSLMLSRSAYVTFVLEEEGAEVDRRPGRDADPPLGQRAEGSARLRDGAPPARARACPRGLACATQTARAPAPWRRRGRGYMDATRDLPGMIELVDALRPAGGLRGDLPRVGRLGRQRPDPPHRTAELRERSRRRTTASPSRLLSCALR